MHSKKNKGVSVVVGYVLLIVITISLSVVAFTFMKRMIPGVDKRVCPEEGVSAIISSYSCNTYASLDGTIFKILELNLTNNGRYSVEGFVIRVNNKTTGIATCTNLPYRGSFFSGSGKNAGAPHFFSPFFKPGEKRTDYLEYQNCGNISAIEILPIKNGEVCQKAITHQDVPAGKCN